MVLLGTVWEPLTAHLMAGPLMVPFLVPAVGAIHGVEVVAGSLVAGEGFVDGSGKDRVAWGPSMEPNPLASFRRQGGQTAGMCGWYFFRYAGCFTTKV